MPLNRALFEQDLMTAFSQTTWALSAQKLALSIDAFIKSGTVQTTVNGIVVPPPPAPPYPATGVGIGTVITTTLPMLQSSIQTAFTSTNWSAVGEALANAINIHLSSSTVTTTDSNILVGTGSGRVIPSGVATLKASLIAAFTTPGKPYAVVVTEVASAIEAFVRSAQVQTVDAGVVPPNSWSGTGVGSIT